MNKIVYRLLIFIIPLIFALGINSPVFGVTTNTYILSEGANNGKIAVRLVYPSSTTNFRYGGKAPVVIFISGGFGSGSLTLAPQISQLNTKGFVVVTFLFPGGQETPYRSQGSFDYRGIKCIQSLRDVIQFCGGITSDTAGRKISNIVHGTVLTNQIGIIAESNGGTLVTAALDTAGYDINSSLGYFVGMENPTSDQLVCLDLGWRQYDCNTSVDGDGNGIPDDDGNNVKYISYGNPVCNMNYATLAYDTSYGLGYIDEASPTQSGITKKGVLFFDNNFTQHVDTMNGCFDLNNNGQLDASDDYLFAGIPTFTNGTALKVHYSIPLITHAINQNVLQVGNWPTHLATLAEDSDYWILRDSNYHYSTLSTKLPNLKCLLICNLRDHEQTQADKPGIQQAYDGFRGQKLWTRINPDPVYLQYILGNSLPSGIPDNDANITITPGTMKNYSEPLALLNYPVASVEASAICEMADRSYYNNWNVNISAVVTIPVQVPDWAKY